MAWCKYIYRYMYMYEFFLQPILRVISRKRIARFSISVTQIALTFLFHIKVLKRKLGLSIYNKYDIAYHGIT